MICDIFGASFSCSPLEIVIQRRARGVLARWGAKRPNLAWLMKVWRRHSLMFDWCNYGWFVCDSDVFFLRKTLQTNMMYDGWVKVLKSEHFLHVDVEGWFMLGILQFCLVCSDAFINLKPLHQISSKPVYSNYFEIMFFRKIDGNGPLLVILKISLDQKRHELTLFWACCKAPRMLQKSKKPCTSRCYKNGCYKCKLMSCKSDLSLHLLSAYEQLRKKWAGLRKVKFVGYQPLVAFKVTSWSPNIGPGTWPNFTMDGSWFLRQPHPSDAQCSRQVSSTDSWWNRQESPEKIMEVLMWRNDDDHTDHFWHITKWLPYFYFLFFLWILLIQHTHCRVCWSMNVNDPRPAALWRSAVWWWINWHLRLHWLPGAVNKHHFNRTSTLHSTHSKKFVFFT